MATGVRIIFILAAVLLGLFPVMACAHHMGQGYGSAPEVVDDYAHGANAQADNQTGNNVGMDEGPDNATVGNGMATSMRGEENNAGGGPGNSGGGPDADTGSGPGSDSGSAGSDGGAGDSGSDSGGGGNGAGSGAGKGRQ